MAVQVQTTSSFVHEQPVKLFEPGAFQGLPGRSFDVSRDSQRFLVVKGTDDKGEATTAAMVVVLNWIEELNARVPRR